MRMLGVSARAAEGTVVLPFVVVSVLAVPIGGIAGLFFSQENAKKALLRMVDSSPAGYVMDIQESVCNSRCGYPGNGTCADKA